MTDASDAPAPAGMSGFRRILFGVSSGMLIASLFMLACGPLLYRSGLVSLDGAMWGLARQATWSAAISALASLALIIASALREPRRWAIVGVAILTAAILMTGRLALLQAQRDTMPPVWDAQTDWMRPIMFSEATRLERAKAGAADVRDDAVIRADAPKPWGGMSVAQSQTAYYDTAPEDDANPNRKDKPYLGIRPTIMKNKPADVLLAARRALEFKGWAVRPAGPDQVEALAISPWYGLAADIAVRVTPEGDGSRIDIRSTSRVGQPDLGANAGRVRSLTTDIAAALRDVRVGKAD